jgi:peptidoglycan/LPS O-acetylase OafA/YrhL
MKLKHLPSLDGIRACAVAMVFVGHAGLDKVVPGGLGVTIFFFLSGFLITSLLRAEWAQTKDISLQQFYVRRAYRILPPLYLVLFIVWLLDLLPGSHNHSTVWGVTSILFYFFNYATHFGLPESHVPTGLVVAWSLMIEEHFYLIFPWVYLAFKRSGKSVRYIVTVLMTSCLLVLVWRCILVFVMHIQVHSPKPWTYNLTDSRFDSILWGCILAIGANPWFGGEISFLSKRKGMFANVGLLLLLVSLLWRDPHFRQTLRYTLQGIALVPIFYYIVSSPNVWQTRWLCWRPLRWLGWVSYSVYLIHLSVLDKLRAYTHWPAWAIGITAALMTLVFAEFVRRTIEIPLRDRNRGTSPLAPQTAPLALETTA